jgi:hypothetical protein
MLYNGGGEGEWANSGGGGGGGGANGGMTPSTSGGLPVQFDEGVLRQLCELDCALPLLTERIKQSLASCKQLSNFFRARARVESSYASSLSEMGREMMEGYGKSDGKAGFVPLPPFPISSLYSESPSLTPHCVLLAGGFSSFVKAYQDTLRLHDSLAQNRFKFATRLTEMADELSTLAKEMEKTRKAHKDTGMRYERLLQDADLAMEKVRSFPL